MLDQIQDWRWDIEDWLWDWRAKRRQRKAIKEKFGKQPEIGDVVCNCKMEHLPIIEFKDEDEVVLEGGGHYSLIHCCSPVPHPDWEH